MPAEEMTVMRRSTRALLLISACAALCAAETPSALQSQPKGWKDILPKPSLQGWTRVAIPPTQPLSPDNQWKVDTRNKLLACEGDKGHEWLRYDRPLADFIFHVEFRYTKLEDEKARYNSGIYGRNDARGDIWHQAQIGGGTGGYFFGVTEAGGERKRLNLLDKTQPSRVKPAGEWNTVEIHAQGDKMSLWVNGDITSVWENMEVRQGHIGLEAEGFRIEFRNLRLKEM
jgi:hypothetical protein